MKTVHKRRGYKQMTAKAFADIKMLTNAGYSISKISDLTGRSISTIHRIRNAKDFDGYKAYVAEQNAKQHPIKPAPGVPLDPNFTAERTVSFEATPQNVDMKRWNSLTTDIIQLKIQLNRMEKALDDLASFLNKKDQPVQAKRGLWRG